MVAVAGGRGLLMSWQRPGGSHDVLARCVIKVSALEAHCGGDVCCDRVLLTSASCYFM